VSFDVESLHHVAIPVRDLERSKRFYGELLGLQEIERPPFDFPGAWYALGDGQLHLIAAGGGTYRSDARVDSRDVHYAIRVASFDEAVELLRSNGYSEDAADDTMAIMVDRHSVTGFPQLYVVDPDRHVIEVNAKPA
jgi:catechol 2,3-dioxygenase-like lactoylglutathione lyase family enzyme